MPKLSILTVYIYIYCTYVYIYIFCANVTGNIGPPSCAGEETQWTVIQEQMGKVKISALCLTLISAAFATFLSGNFLEQHCLHYSMLSLVPQNALQVHVRLDRSLRLCGDNETDPDCCVKPLCVLETLQLSACVNDTPQASVLIQARIHAQLHPVTGSGRA